MWGPTLTAGGGMDYDLPFFNQQVLASPLPGGLSATIHADFGPTTWHVPTAGVSWAAAPISRRRRPQHRHRDALRPHHPAAAGYFLLRGQPRRSGYPGDPHHGHRHGAQPESEEDGRPTVGAQHRRHDLRHQQHRYHRHQGRSPPGPTRPRAMSPKANQARPDGGLLG